MKSKGFGVIGRRTVLKGSLLAAAALALTGHRALAAPTPFVPGVRLGNGLTMPALGFGTYSLRGDLCTESVADAIAAGYRLIDTAKVYENEEAVGAGIRKSGIERKSLFVTSKIWVDDSGYERGKRAFQETLDKLGLDYLDLYLIHRPRGDVAGSWRAMEDLHQAGKIRAIGVSNFDEEQLAAVMSRAKVKPAVNQLETHPFFQQGSELGSLKSAGVQKSRSSPRESGHLRFPARCRRYAADIGAGSEPVAISRVDLTAARQSLA